MLKGCKKGVKRSKKVFGRRHVGAGGGFGGSEDYRIVFRRDLARYAQGLRPWAADFNGSTNMPPLPKRVPKGAPKAAQRASQEGF